jgi:AcrR family transcriptional regulator
MLLREAGVARGTLYHHFPSADALLQSTLVEVFTHRAERNIALMKQAVSKSESREQFIGALRYITEISQAPAQRTDRLDRIRLVAHTEDSPALRRVMAREQERLTATLIWIVKTGQRRGWVRRDLPARPVAVLVQAYTLGRIVDDLAEKKMRQQEWIDLIETLVIGGVTRLV